MIKGDPIVFTMGDDCRLVAQILGSDTSEDTTPNCEYDDIFNFGDIDLSSIDDDSDDDDYDDDAVTAVKKAMKKSKKKKEKKKKKTVDIAAVKAVRKDDMEAVKMASAEKARKRAEKKRAEYERARHQAEIDIIQLQARRDYLTAALGKLVPGKKKDTIKIVNINVELRNIDATIVDLQTKYGIQVANINRGSKFSRFCNSVKRGAKRVFNKVSKFCNRHKETIIGLTSIILPVVGSMIASVFIHR